MDEIVTQPGHLLRKFLFIHVMEDLSQLGIWMNGWLWIQFSLDRLKLCVYITNKINIYYLQIKSF